ncbi:hypothetical protein F53441_1352 [Fusarium austroafricanum]|uniref:Uncharacterized protein n=1 Tax=Fusarium austroafricanum TaxID=2364996 RepID=A0A8H4KS82_9HYPO|nr:hypothetical protein F53441_1352 [Fusarium austroafricanum]
MPCPNDVLKALAIKKLVESNLKGLWPYEDDGYGATHIILHGCDEMYEAVVFANPKKGDGPAKILMRSGESPRLEDIFNRLLKETMKRLSESLSDV